MAEGTRRGVVVALLLLAVLGAVGLMTSGLTGDPEWRMWQQVLGTGAALGSGTVCTVVAWRWWSGHWSEDRSRR